MKTKRKINMIVWMLIVASTGYFLPLLSATFQAEQLSADECNVVEKALMESVNDGLGDLSQPEDLMYLPMFAHSAPTPMMGMADTVMLNQEQPHAFLDSLVWDLMQRPEEDQFWIIVTAAALAMGLMALGYSMAPRMVKAAGPKMKAGAARIRDVASRPFSKPADFEEEFHSCLDDAISDSKVATEEYVDDHSLSEYQVEELISQNAITTSDIGDHIRDYACDMGYQGSDDVETQIEETLDGKCYMDSEEVDTRIEDAVSEYAIHARVKEMVDEKLLGYNDAIAVNRCIDLKAEENLKTMQGFLTATPMTATEVADSQAPSLMARIASLETELEKLKNS